MPEIWQVAAKWQHDGSNDFFLPHYCISNYAPLTYSNDTIHFLYAYANDAYKMIFIETSIFTEDVTSLLSDDEYREFQLFLAENPTEGDVIKDTGGLRKVRWSSGGKGKRGGVRIIYYHKLSEAQIRLLVIYKKGIKDDLSADEKRALRALNERW